MISPMFVVATMSFWCVADFILTVFAYANDIAAVTDCLHSLHSISFLQLFGIFVCGVKQMCVHDCMLVVFLVPSGA